jgi:magnesium transporter
MVQRQLREVYFLTQILEVPVTWRGKKIGKLKDVFIAENGKLPEVTHIYVGRSFGNASLIVPLEKVVLMGAEEAVVDIESLEKYEGEPVPEVFLLKDHILDKKVVDIEDREVEVVYDVKMVLQGGRLYVSAVDLSKYGLLRRMHLKWFADIIYPRYQENKDIIPWTYIQPLPSDIGSFKGDVKLTVLKEKLAEMPPADVADILEEMDPGQRVKVFNVMEPGQASDTLEEIDPNVQRALVSALKKEKAAKLINDMTPAQAADILSVLPLAEAGKILELLDKKDVKKIRTIMDKQEEEIIHFATQDFIKLPPETLVGQVEDGFQNLARDKDVIMYFYIVSENDKLLGVADLKEILKADNGLKISDIMIDNVVSLNQESTLKEAYFEFARYGFRALPITDKEGRILGVVPYRDVMNLKHKFLK